MVASAVVRFSSADIDLAPFVAGRKGIPGFIISTLGIRNAVESDAEWPAVGWETIAPRDRRRFPANDHEVKPEFLRNAPVTRETTAVKEDRIADGIETIVDALEGSDLGNR